MQRNGRHEQRALPPGRVLVPAAAQSRQGGIQRGKEHHAAQKPHRRREPAGKSNVRRPVNGRQQQAPHGGRRHDSSSKAQQGLLKVGPGFPGEKKHHGRAQSGHQKCEARTQGRPAKRLQHSTNAFSLIQAEHRPYASISGRTSRRDRACIRGRCVIWYRQQEKLI